MAGIENLFAVEPTLPNTQTTKLPDDPQQWTEVITTRLREQYPEVTRLPLSVEYRKQDSQNGTAIGAVQVSGPDSGKLIHVPFIIKKFELFPLDIWMEAKTQEVHPLTNETFKQEFFVRSIAEGLDQRPFDAAGQYFNDPSLWTTNYPPLQGRYSYASAGYQILDQISDTIKKEHVEAFRKTIEKHAMSLVKFRSHKNSPIEAIQKIAKKDSKNQNDFVESAKKLIPIGATIIKKETPDKYSVLSMPDQLFDLGQTEYMNRDDCQKFLSKISPKPWEFLHEVDTEGEKMLIVKKAPEKGVFLYDDIRMKPEAVTEFAPYVVKNKMGMDIRGVVIPHVVDFAGKKQPFKLFLSPEHSSLQGQIAGVKLPDNDIFLQMFKNPKGARVGETGTFLYVEAGKAIASIPVTITGMENHYSQMTATTLSGRKITICRGWSNEAPTNYTASSGSKGKKEKNFLDIHGMLETKPDVYTIPRSMVWYPMSGFQDVSSTSDEWLSKEAASHMGPDPLTIRWTGIVYDLSGSGMDKVALDERHTKLLLATRGATLDKVAQIIKKAHAIGKVQIHGLLPLRKMAEIEKHAKETYDRLEGICSNLRCDFFKIAGEIDDSMTVDALLSLGFINPENLSKFVSYRPVFEKVLDYLAELTLASRLGLKDVSEGALVTTMGRLGEVIEGLKKAENSLKKPGIKTAGAKGAARIINTGHKLLTAAGATAALTAAAKHNKKEAEVSFKDGLDKSAAPAKPAPGKKESGDKKPAQAPAGPAASMMGGMGAMGGTPQSNGKGPTKEGNPFGDGMVDGEMGAHMYLERWRNDPKAMLAYLNGKRTAEMNKATSAMGAGFQPPNGLKPQKPPTPPKPGGASPGGAKK